MRIEYFDQAKGFAIFLMVFAHAIAWNYGDWQSVCVYHNGQEYPEIIGGLLWNVIYAFHMPLFFLVAGYFTPPHTQNTRLSWEECYKLLYKRTKRLLIPYLTTGFIIYFVRGHWGYWFFLSLWQLSIIGCVFTLICQMMNKKYSLTIDILIAGILYFILFTVQSRVEFEDTYDVFKFESYMPPYIIGIILSRHKKTFDMIISSNNVYMFSFVCFISLFATMYFDQSWSVAMQKILYFMRYYILPILGSIICLSLFYSNHQNVVCKMLGKIGKRTSEIYVLHILFVIQVPMVGEFILCQQPFTSITLQIVIFSVFSAIAIGLSIVFSMPLKKSKLLNSLLFGY